MSWIQTYTGKKFYFDAYSPHDICLEDIAHALAFICRYGGHSSMHYSVAEHSMAVAGYLLHAGHEQEGRQALLHDATEAYIGDMVRPLKQLIPDFQKYEDGLAEVILHKYGLPTTLSPLVKEADTRILLNEKAFLFPPDKQLLWDMEPTMKPLENIQLAGLDCDSAFRLFHDVLKEEFGKYE